MNRFAKTAIAALGFSIAAAGAAHASGEQKALEMCVDEIKTEAPSEAASFVFKSMRGASLRSLTFEVKSENSTQEVVCKVRRGNVVGLNWAS